MTDQLAEIEAAVRPWRWQIRSGQRIGDKQQRNKRHDPAGGAAGRFQQEDDEDETKHNVQAGRQGRAIREFLAAFDGVDQDGGGGDSGNDVPPPDAVAEARRQREQEKAQPQNERDVRIAQRLGRDDREIGERPGARNRGIEVEQGHRHSQCCDTGARPPGKAIEGAFLGLDENFGLPQMLTGHRRRGRRSLDSVLGHSRLCLFRKCGLKTGKPAPYHVQPPGCTTLNLTAIGISENCCG